MAITLKEEVAKGVGQKPLQFALIGVVAIGIVYYGFKKLVPDMGDILKKRAEGVSTNNPFSYVDFLKQKTPIGTLLLSSSGATQNAKTIYNALNTYFSDNADMVIGVFNALKNKLSVAQVSQAFFVSYKRDILDYLKKGKKTFDFGSGGLSNEDYERILTIVNKKPKY